MRTLNEVIKAVEEDLECANVSYSEVFYDYDNHKDALHYLKEYKIKRERIIAKAQDCEDTEKRLQNEINRYQDAVKEYEEILTDYVALKQYWAEQQANNPLTLDELKAMEGKPVWVEHRSGKKGWCLIVQVDDSLPDIPCVGLVDTDADYRNLEVEWMDMGQWQAYRKEREHEPDQKAH